MVDDDRKEIARIIKINKNIFGFPVKFGKSMTVIPLYINIIVYFKKKQAIKLKKKKNLQMCCMIVKELLES